MPEQFLMSGKFSAAFSFTPGINRGMATPRRDQTVETVSHITLGPNTQLKLGVNECR